MYGINWTKFVEERVMSPIRKPKMRALIHALLTPTKTLHTNFIAFKSAQELDLKITPQVRILEYWLNELYDKALRRIHIEDYVNTEPILIWGESYNNPIYLPEFLSSKEFDFTVFLPIGAGLKPQEVAIRAFLDKYKLAGKRYLIVYE